MHPIITPSPNETRAYRDVLGCFATGVCVITAQYQGAPIGMTANSFTSLSMDPPLVMWAPARASRRYPAFAGAAHFAIHVLAADQAGLAQHFARAGDDFALPGLGLSDEGVVTLPHVLARFDCALHAVHEAGDHAILIGRVLRATRGQGAPLVFAAGRMQALQPHAA